MICIDFVTMCNYNHDEKAIMKLHQTYTVCSTYNGTLLVSKAGERYFISIHFNHFNFVIIADYRSVIVRPGLESLEGTFD